MPDSCNDHPRIVRDQRVCRDNDGLWRREIDVEFRGEHWRVLVFDQTSDTADIGFVVRGGIAYGLWDGEDMLNAISPSGRVAPVLHLDERDPNFLAVCRVLQDELGARRVEIQRGPRPAGERPTGVGRVVAIADLLRAGASREGA